MVTGSQEPRIKVLPEGEDHPRWDEIVRFVKGLGYVLDPWQWMVLRAALMRSGGYWAAFKVVVCAPRQNGKNSLLEVLALVKAVLLEEKLIIHTAHLADTAKEAFHRLDDLIDVNGIETEHIWRTNGMETIEFPGNRRIRFRTRTKGGGRGYAGCNTAIFDEAMFLPEVSVGSIIPVISASPDPQIVLTGSAVDQEIMEDGVAFARAREQALSEKPGRIAYFEWSLDFDDPDAVDLDGDLMLEAVASTNPAYGIRISPEYIKEEIRTIEPRTFSTERLGVGDWPSTDRAATVIDLNKWGSLYDQASTITGPVVFAIDVQPERAWSSICASGARSDGVAHVEVVERRRRTDWIVTRMAELARRHKPAAVVCDSLSPAASLIPELQEAGIEVTPLDTRDMVNACGFVFDAVEDGTLRHLGQPELLSALKGAAKRDLGDSWAWSRKNSTGDISPLVAATLALWTHSTTASNEVFALAW